MLACPHGFWCACAFDNPDEAVCLHISESLHCSVRPAHLERIDRRPSLEAEVQAGVVLREVASAAAPLVPLDEIAGATVTTAPSALRFDVRAGEIDRRGSCWRFPPSLRSSVGAPSRSLMTTSRSPSLSRSPNAAPRLTRGRAERRPGVLADLGERAVATIPIQQLALPVGRRRAAGALHLRIDVAVDDEQIQPAVVVVVEEPRAPADERQARLRGLRGDTTRR